MSNNYIESDNDLFGLDIPTIDPDGEMSTSQSVDVSDSNIAHNLLQDNPIVVYSGIGLIALLILILLVFTIKKLIVKNKDPLVEFTKTKSKNKNQQAYVSSANKLDTADSLSENIRMFLERTR